MMDPNDPQVLYIGGRYSGLYKGENGGLAWRPINQGLTTFSILSLAADPQRSNIVYPGTDGGGIFKTVNGGDS